MQVVGLAVGSVRSRYALVSLLTLCTLHQNPGVIRRIAAVLLVGICVGPYVLAAGLIHVMAVGIVGVFDVEITRLAVGSGRALYALLSLRSLYSLDALNTLLALGALRPRISGISLRAALDLDNGHRSGKGRAIRLGGRHYGRCVIRCQRINVENAVRDMAGAACINHTELPSALQGGPIENIYLRAGQCADNGPAGVAGHPGILVR